jgi:hypothetical protein
MSAADRLPPREHTSRPWRIHELVPDFRLEDVWGLPTPGGAGDFHLLVRETARLDPEEAGSRVVRELFALRWRIGGLLGWDEEGGPGTSEPTLRDRLPEDLLGGEGGAEFLALPFRPLYLTDDEFAAEIANRTVHAVMHLAWVEAPGGGYRGQMAVLAKPNGLLGTAYMTAISPFRHLIVYPTMMREIEREWPARSGLGRR